EAVAALEGSHLIVHAGDVGAPDVLEALRRIAPVVAVRGNNDRDAWARSLPETTRLEVAGATLYVLHDVHELAIDPVAEGVRAVTAGHSQKPSVLERDGVWFVNPGSAGPRRFSLPVAVARLTIRAEGMTPELIELRV